MAAKIVEYDQRFGDREVKHRALKSQLAFLMKHRVSM